MNIVRILAWPLLLATYQRHGADGIHNKGLHIRVGVCVFIGP